MRRSMLLCAASLVGCLQAQASPRHVTDPSVLTEFSRLVDDPKRIEDAATFAELRHLSREETHASSLTAYTRFMQVEAYATAAQIAWRFGFGQAAIDTPMSLQRRRAILSGEEYRDHQGQEDAAVKRLSAESEFQNESLIGCVYGAKKEDAKAVVEDTLAFRHLTNDDDVLYPLLDDQCPVEPATRDLIIYLALSHYKYDFAIRHAVSADWIPEKRLEFAGIFFRNPRCADGFRVVGIMHLRAADVVPMVELSECEQLAIATKDWALDPSDARSYFFAAVRGRKYNLALVLLPFCAFDENGRLYLFQEVLRANRGLEMIKLFLFHAGLHDDFMSYAFERGRYRFVGTHSQTYAWQRKAFDRLVEIGQYDFAAEVAQYGFSETFRTEGINLAFKAAMKAGDFKMGRYFVARYGPTATSPGLVTQEMFDEEQRQTYAAKAAANGGQIQPEPPKPEPPKKVRPPPKKEPPCRKDDWNVKPCK